MYQEWEVKVLIAQACPTLCKPARLLCPRNSLSKNTGVGSHSILQGIFLIRDQTQASHITGKFFTVWATKKAQIYSDLCPI